MNTQLIKLLLASRTRRNQTWKKRKILCLVAFTFFLPSKTETDEPQWNRNNPLLAVDVFSAYLDAAIVTKMLPTTFNKSLINL